MIERCSEEIFEEYKELRKEKLEKLTVIRMSDPETSITTLIGEYEACKQLLIEHENYYERKAIEYENLLYKQKHIYMEKGAKSTEAKEKAKIFLEPSTLELKDMEQDTDILKAYLHSLEYQLRLKFKQMKNETGFQPSLQDILEAR